MTSKIRNHYLSVRVTSDQYKQFCDKALKIGKPSEVLREIVDAFNRMVSPDNVGGVYAISIVLSMDSMLLPEFMVTPDIIPPTVWFGVIACCKIVVDDVATDPVINPTTVSDPVIIALPLTDMDIPSSYTILCCKDPPPEEAFTR